MIKAKPKYPCTFWDCKRIGKHQRFGFYCALALKNIICLMIEHYVHCNGSEGKENGVDSF